MAMPRKISVVLLSFLLVVALAPMSGAIDMNSVLNDHAPADDAPAATSQTAAPQAPTVTASATAPAQPAGGDFFDKVLEKLNQILSRLTNILSNLKKFAATLTAPATTQSNPPARTPATPTPAPTAPPAAGAKGGKALLGWLQQAGLSGENLRMAWSISMAESGGDPRAFNGNARTGDKSYGLFQINMLGNLGPARLREFGISSNEQLFDPATNIRAMLKVSNNCRSWTPWSVYKNGRYRTYYNQYPPR